MGMESYQNGRQGEEDAEKYLSQRGYQIIDRNYHSQQGEIDLIARDGQYLVFVEVKSYSFRCYGSPAGAVRKAKKQSIIHAAETYLYKNKIKDTYCRFDVVTLYRKHDGSQAIELYKNAFGVN
jgi:putative endonuclease